MKAWSFAFRLFAALVLGCGAAWGLMLVVVLSLHTWPYPTLAFLFLVAALVMRGFGR
jgi:hypothetical protein